MHSKEKKISISYCLKKNTKLRKKPWWCADLHQMWDDVCKKERAWLNHKGGSGQNYKREYVQSRRSFSYAMRKEKRRYQKKIMDDLQQACDNSQIEFWKKVKSTGIQADRKDPLPSMIKDPNGNLLSDPNQIKEQWIKQFRHAESENVYDNNYHNWIKCQVKNAESTGGIINDNSTDLTMNRQESLRLLLYNS